MTYGQFMGRRPRKAEDLAGRVELILGKASELMARHGYQGFTMADLAREIDYAKGTLYLHFQSKEDMAAAMSARNLERRAQLLEVASDVSCESREQFMALMLAEQRFYAEVPGHFSWDQMLHQPSFWEKVSEERKQAHSAATARCLSCIEKVVRRAVDCGDLEMDEKRIRPTVLMLVAFALGQTMVVAAKELRDYAKISESFRMLEEGLQTLLDGLGWGPLGDEFHWKIRRPALLRKLKPIFFRH